MIDLRSEVALRGLEGVVTGEGYVHEEDTTVIGRVLRPHYSCLPVEHIVT